jgi:hypothetical protein
MKNGFEKIDLAQDPRYQELFDLAGELGYMAIDHAGDTYMAFGEDHLKVLIMGLVGDLWNSSARNGPKDWSPYPQSGIGPDGVEILVKALENYLEDHQLERTDEFIRNSLTSAWETALLPTYRDMKYAVEDARNLVIQKAELGPLWDPLVHGPAYKGDFNDPHEILRSLMDRVYYGWDNGKTTLVFAPMDSQAVWTLTQVDKSVTTQQLDAEFVYLRDFLTGSFFEVLGETMADVDPGKRVSISKQWREDLADKRKVEAVQKELLEYLHGRQRS